jgi:hypothetical protein
MNLLYLTLVYWVLIVNNENYGEIVDVIKHIENILINQYVHPIY